MKKYYIYNDYFLNEEEFIVKAKKDYENEEEDTKDAFTLEEYMEDIFLLDYSLIKVLEIDEDVLKKSETISDLDCEVLNILTEDMDTCDELIQKYMDNINMGDYCDAIKDSSWTYSIGDDWSLVINFDIENYIPWEDNEYTEVKYKSFKIMKED